MSSQRQSVGPCLTPRLYNMYNETRGTLPGATPLCFDTALLHGQLCCQPLLLLEKLKAMSQKGGGPKKV